MSLELILTSSSKMHDIQIKWLVLVFLFCVFLCSCTSNDSSEPDVASEALQCSGLFFVLTSIDTTGVVAKPYGNPYVGPGNQLFGQVASDFV